MQFRIGESFRENGEPLVPVELTGRSSEINRVGLQAGWWGTGGLMHSYQRRHGPLPEGVEAAALLAVYPHTRPAVTRLLEGMGWQPGS